MSAGATGSIGPNGAIVEVTENAGEPDTITTLLPKSLASTGRLFTRLKAVVSPAS